MNLTYRTSNLSAPRRGAIRALVGSATLAGALACLLGSPAVSAAKDCRAPSYPGSGYFTELSVSSTSCTSGRAVTLAHYRCRTKHGKAGRCSVPVLGYRCSERRRAIPTEIDAVVTCRSGHRKVVYGYQQNT